MLDRNSKEGQVVPGTWSETARSCVKSGEVSSCGNLNRVFMSRVSVVLTPHRYIGFLNPLHWMSFKSEEKSCWTQRKIGPKPETEVITTS